MNKFLAIFAILALLASAPSQSADEGHHPHHIGVDVGVANHGSENSAFIGVDYSYRFQNDFALGVYYEEVNGDFDLLAFGFAVGKYFDNGWKVSTGPGMETKLKDGKNLFLWHVAAGYDWHNGSWSYGPVAKIDFIEDASTTYYLGFAVGYGF